MNIICNSLGRLSYPQQAIIYMTCGLLAGKVADWTVVTFSHRLGLQKEQLSFFARFTVLCGFAASTTLKITNIFADIFKISYKGKAALVLITSCLSYLSTKYSFQSPDLNHNLTLDDPPANVKPESSASDNTPIAPDQGAIEEAKQHIEALLLQVNSNRTQGYIIAQQSEELLRLNNKTGTYLIAGDLELLREAEKLGDKIPKEDPIWASIYLALASCQELGYTNSAATIDYAKKAFYLANQLDSLDQICKMDIYLHYGIACIKEKKFVEACDSLLDGLKIASLLIKREDEYFCLAYKHLKLAVAEMPKTEDSDKNIKDYEAMLEFLSLYSDWLKTRKSFIDDLKTKVLKKKWNSVWFETSDHKGLSSEHIIPEILCLALQSARMSQDKDIKAKLPEFIKKAEALLATNNPILLTQEERISLCVVLCEHYVILKGYNKLYSTSLNLVPSQGDFIDILEDEKVPAKLLGYYYALQAAVGLENPALIKTNKDAILKYDSNSLSGKKGSSIKSYAEKIVCPF